MVKESVTNALADANVKYTDIDQAVCGYVFGLYFTNLTADLDSSNVNIVS